MDEKWIERKDAAKVWISKKITDTKVWIEDNKELVIVVTPIIFGTFTKILSKNAKKNRLQKEDDLRNLYCYDRSLGHYWHLKRQLTNRDWIEINRRRNNGEPLGDILSVMNVLK